MSRLGDALKLLQDVVSLRGRIIGMEAELVANRTDIKDLTRLVIDLNMRLSRLEGFVEGAAASAAWRLPKE